MSWLRWILGIAAIVLAVVFVLLVTVPRSDWAHRQVRSVVLDAVDDRVNGTVEIGDISGDLLREAVLEDVVVRDSAGAPVVTAERLRLRYALLPLVRERLLVRQIELVEPDVLLERAPDGPWNLARLLRSEDAPPAASDAEGGFGSWIRIREATVRDGHLTVRTPWSPPDRLEGTALDSAVSAALSDRSRARIERAGNGYRVVRELRDLDVRLADLVVADPRRPVSGELLSLSTVALPFRPPALTVRSLRGGFRITEDSLRIREVVLELSRSRLTGSGSVARESGLARGRIDVERLVPADLAWLAPEIPRDGEATLDLEVTRDAGGRELRLEATGVDARLEGARLRGRAEVFVAKTARPGGTDLRFSGVDARLVERLAPDVEIPVDGAAGGRIQLRPEGDAVRVEGALAFRERATGAESRVSVDGRAALPAADRVRGLRVRLHPLRLSLVESAAGPLPVEGRVEGRVTLGGAPGGPLSAELDLEHLGGTGTTRLLGEVSLGPPGPSRPVRLDVRAPVVSLATVGELVPAAGLRGSASGTLTASGTLSRLAGELGIRLGSGGGELRASGTVGMERPEPHYDVRARLDGLDVHAASERAPSTRLSGTVALEGRGADPAEMEVELTARLAGSTVDSTGPLAADLRVRASDGLLRVRRGELSAASASASFEGTFGLARGRSGDLRVRVAVDSLSDFAGRVPPDTVAFPARPAPQARRLAEARADSARRAREAEVERAATGHPPAPRIDPDTLRALSRDSLSGSARLEATVSGGLDRLDAGGRLELRDVVAFGSRTGDGRVEFDVEDLRASRPDLTLDVGLEAVRMAGFAFDSLGLRVEHAGTPTEGEGSVTAVVVQDADRDYRFRAGYTLTVDARELRLERMELRFDTVRWAATGPGTIRWGGSGVAVDSLELRTGGDGRIFVDGRFVAADTLSPETDSLVVTADALPLAHVVGILQDTLDASGRIELRLRASGPPDRARLDGTVSLTDAALGDAPLPALSARASYAPGELDVGLRMLEHPAFAGAVRDTLVTAEGTVGIDLFGGGSGEPRSLDVSIAADSLPLESLPVFTDAVSDVRGRLRGRIAVGGTVDAPDVAGRVDLDLGRLDVVWPGVRLRDVVGTLHLRGDSLRLDSLRARTAGGAVRMAGAADLSTPGTPRLDVRLSADDAVVMDNHIGEDVRIDGEITVAGPLQTLDVGGRVRVREGILTVPETREEVVDLETPPARQAVASVSVDPEAVPEPNPILDGLRMNVELGVSRNTWVRADEGTAEVYTPEDGAPLLVRFGVGDGGLVIDGIIHADRGEYSFAGRRFELTTGTATFLAAREVDPLLSLTATHEVPRPGREALTIQINVGGRLFEPRVTLTSNAEPPLSQTDLISYLVFGTSSTALVQPGSSVVTGGDDRGLGALATQQLASLAVGSLVEEAFNSVESRTRGSGLDVFRIEPADLPEELAFDGYLQNLLRGTQFEAGKYLGRGLFVAATGRATTEAWPGFTVEYRTPGGFRLSGSWQPRYLPSLPSFDPDAEATQTRALGLFLFWERRAPFRSGAAPAASPAGATEPVGGDPPE